MKRNNSDNNSTTTSNRSSSRSRNTTASAAAAATNKKPASSNRCYLLFVLVLSGYAFLSVALSNSIATSNLYDSNANTNANVGTRTMPGGVTVAGSLKGFHGNKGKVNITSNIPTKPKPISTTATTTKTNTTATTATKTARNAAMVLAAAPLDKRHVTALWSELDCFTRDTDLKRVLVVAPLWSRDLIRRIVREAKQKLPHFAGDDPLVRLEARFFKNDRYDVGLWCDGLESLLGSSSSSSSNTNGIGNEIGSTNGIDNEIDDVLLLNDSLFALRPFTGILDALRGHNYDPQIPYSNSNGNNNNYNGNDNNNNEFVEFDPHTTKRSMVSLSYSLTDPAGMWLESVYRAFDRDGLQKYRDHSCKDASHAANCPNVTDSREKKKCLVYHHEISVARLFDDDKNNKSDKNNKATNSNTNTTSRIEGLYPSDVPPDMWKPDRPYGTWASHKEYWLSVLVEKFNFPAAKVSKRNMIRTMKDPLIQTCTARFDRTMFETEASVFDFSAGVRTIQRNGNGNGNTDERASERTSE